MQKTLIEIKKEKEENINKLCVDCGAFFAFSNEQFDENRTPLAEGDKYVSFGGGGYMPKSNKIKWFEGMVAIGKKFFDDIDNNNLKEEYILYELNNHEAFYTGDITSTKEVFGEIYTDEEVMAVYKKFAN